MGDSEKLIVAEAAKMIESVRADLLFWPDEDREELGPIAQVCFIKALDHLSLAMFEMKMCDYFRLKNE